MRLGLVLPGARTCSFTCLSTGGCPWQGRVDLAESWVQGWAPPLPSWGSPSKSPHCFGSSFQS